MVTRAPGAVPVEQILCDAVVGREEGGQFNVGQHALCWVHAERLVHKLDAFTDKHRAAQTQARSLIWDFYADLKAYRLRPNPRRAGALRKRFSIYILLRRTGFLTLDRLLKGDTLQVELLMLDGNMMKLIGETISRCQEMRGAGQRLEPAAMSAATAGRVSRLAKTCDKLHRGLGLSGQQAQGGGAYCDPTTRPLCPRALPAGLTCGPPGFCPCYKHWLQNIEITKFPERHFWHRGYDKATTAVVTMPQAMSETASAAVQSFSVA